MSKLKTAEQIHGRVPPDWYHSSIKNNLFQRFWHKRRLREVRRLVEPTGGKILDIGCADGSFTKAILDKSNAEVIYGIDVLNESILWAKKHWKSKKMKFFVGDAHKLNFKASSFDAVFALEVLEHVFEPVKVLKEIKRVLRVGGYAVFLVPTESFLFRIVWFIWGFYKGKIWKETHIHAYRNDYLVRLCEQVDFRVEANKKFLLGMLQIVKVRK